MDFRLLGVFDETAPLLQWLFSPVALIRTLLRKTGGAKIIHTVKTIWPGQNAVFEFLS